MKKITMILLTGALAVGLLTSCGNDGGNGESVQSSGTKENAQSGNAENGNTEAGASLTKVRILCKNDNVADVKTENWMDLKVGQALAEKLAEIGIELELECVDNESFSKVVSTRMAADSDMPDLIGWMGESSTTVEDWARGGLLYPVNELVDQYDTDDSIRAFYDKVAPGVWNAQTMADGNLYWFSYISHGVECFETKSQTPYLSKGGYTMQIRKDWVEAVGEELKLCYTPEELFTLLKKIHDEDANGNGIPDEVVAFDIGGFDNVISRAYGMNSRPLAGYFNQDNVVFSNFYHENFPAYIEYMQRLYQEGIYDTQALSLSVDEMIASNVASAIVNYDCMNVESPNWSDFDESKEYYYPIIVDADGDYTNGYTYMVDNYTSVCYGQFFIPKGAKNPEAVLKLMDFWYTDEAALMNQLGLEGMGYEYAENGVIINHNVAGTENTSLQAIGIGMHALPHICMYGFEVELNPEGTPRFMVGKNEWNFQWRIDWSKYIDKEEYSVPFLALPTTEETERLNEISSSLTTYAEELLVDLILGEKSMDDYPAYLQEMENLGLKDYIAIMQARRDRVVRAD